MNNNRVLFDDVREAYRVSNKYWKTGDVDILPKKIETARAIDNKYWSEISSIVDLTAKKHLPVYVLSYVLKEFGYEIVAEVEDEE